jgi:hypothetical protein
MESNQTNPQTYTKEVKCPVSMHRRVIGHNVIRASYVDDRLVEVKLVQFVPSSEIKEKAKA